MKYVIIFAALLISPCMQSSKKPCYKPDLYPTLCAESPREMAELTNPLSRENPQKRAALLQAIARYKSIASGPKAVVNISRVQKIQDEYNALRKEFIVKRREEMGKPIYKKGKAKVVKVPATRARKIAVHVQAVKKK